MRSTADAWDDEALRADVAALNASLRELGAASHPAWAGARGWILGLALAMGGMLAWYREDLPWALRVASLLVSTVGSVAMATAAHTASHGALAERRWVNQVFFYATYPFFLMVSARYWHRSHVQVHHGAPNVVDVDLDCDLRPLFGINEAHAGQLAVPLRRLQRWLIVLVLPFNGFNIQRQGWKRLVHELSQPRTRTSAAYLDLFAMALHVVVFIVVPAVVYSPGLALATYAFRVALIGVALFAVLAPGHYPAEAACLHESQRRGAHLWVRQTVATVNFRTGFFGRWLCSGLEYQVEHHLLPHVSHVHLRAVSAEVRAVCERHGLPHRTLGWGQAIVGSWRVFSEPKAVVHDVHSLRTKRP